MSKTLAIAWLVFLAHMTILSATRYKTAEVKQDVSKYLSVAAR